MLVPAFVSFIGLSWFIASVLLPKAPLGDPNGPMYYPLILSGFLFVMGVIYFIQELKVRHQEKGILKKLFAGRTPKLIIAALILSILYTLTFEKLGFLVSTIIFLGLLLFVINGFRGWKKWVTNIAVAVLFSFVLWYGFSQLLGIGLP